MGGAGLTSSSATGAAMGATCGRGRRGRRTGMSLFPDRSSCSRSRRSCSCRSRTSGGRGSGKTRAGSSPSGSVSGAGPSEPAAGPVGRTTPAGADCGGRSGEAGADVGAPGRPASAGTTGTSDVRAVPSGGVGAVWAGSLTFTGARVGSTTGTSCPAGAVEVGAAEAGAVELGLEGTARSACSAGAVCGSRVGTGSGAACRANGGVGAVTSSRRPGPSVGPSVGGVFRAMVSMNDAGRSGEGRSVSSPEGAALTGAGSGGRRPSGGCALRPAARASCTSP